MRPEEFKIEDGKIYENDKLSRDRETELLKRVLKNATGPFVLSIDAPWGTGKSVFIKMLREELKEIDSIFINAWESDYNSDPLFTIISELKGITSSSTFRNIESGFLTFSKIVAPALVSVATGGVIKTENIADAISDVTKNVLENRIKNYENEKESIDNLKKGLTKAASDTEGGKIIIFIDELDRCKPTYAIEFLERVKHFFDLKGFIFVLSLDSLQLSNSIKAVYGNEFNSKEYLKRFIDYSYQLNRTINKNYINSKFETIGFGSLLTSKSREREVDEICEVLLTLSVKLNVRDVEQIVSKINIIYLCFIDQLRDTDFMYIVLLASLKQLNLSVYKRYLKYEVGVEEMINVLGISPSFISKQNWKEANIKGLISQTAKDGNEYLQSIKTSGPDNASFQVIEKRDYYSRARLNYLLNMIEGENLTT